MPGDPFYQTHAWVKLRARVYKRDGWCCVWCGESVRGKGKARCDHIIPRKERPDLAMREDNLRTLCCDCDAIRHREKGGGDPIVGCDAKGVPLSPRHHWRSPIAQSKPGSAPGAAPARPSGHVVRRGSPHR